MMKKNNKERFAVFILSHGRAEKVQTYNLLKKDNYTGEVYIVIDDNDKEKEKYIKNFGKEKIIIFSKKEIRKSFDMVDNFKDEKTVLFARNAIFKIAKKMEIEYFLVLDDDYSGFALRYDKNLNFKYIRIKNLNKLFKILLRYYKIAPIYSLGVAQGGDFMGGEKNNFLESILRKRKCMNSFYCSTEREYDFIGRMNDDVNTYVKHSKLGRVFLTIPVVGLTQGMTQKNKGGLTEMYLNYGTYVKSFYTVIISPSSTKIMLMGTKNKRLHHKIVAKSTYPMILREEIKKK